MLQVDCWTCKFSYLCSFIGFICSIMIVVLFTKLPIPKVFSLKIVMFFSSTLSLFYFFKFILIFTQKLCFLQAFFINYSRQSVLIWLLIIPYTTKLNMIEKNQGLSLSESFFLLASFCMPIISSLV